MIQQLLSWVHIQSGYQWGKGRGEGQNRDRGLGGTNLLNCTNSTKISYKGIFYNTGNINNVL